MSKLNWVTKLCGVFLLWVAAAAALPAQGFSTLYSFCLHTGCLDGSGANAGVVQGTDGNLYGTTTGGGADSDGTVFKITPDGMLTTLQSFDGTDGYPPVAGLLQGTDGDFYGTTVSGGAIGQGNIFKITPGGAVTTIYSFCSHINNNGVCADGSNPSGGLVQDANGNFYGTTFSGGANNNGTVFRVTPSGALTILHNFDYTDGSHPVAGVIQGSDGNLYGTTQNGGANAACPGGCGTVFQITSGRALTTLYSFCAQSDCTDGESPVTGLVEGSDRNFYGTTYEGGVSDDGTVFQITPGGTFMTLHSFIGTDGHWPEGVLIQAANGDFYGTTLGGGIHGDGEVFKITAGGTVTTLHSFDMSDGYLPTAGLIQATNGTFYGTTSSGGAGGLGTVFRLSVGMGPFVKPEPSSGMVGAHVKILGNNLTGATSVAFNGTAAVFTVVSHSLITTTVPAGATSGTVQVVTSGGGTLKSNVAFTVLP
jgi:uncharacterized repeat protein (TIGR03803 family)